MGAGEFGEATLEDSIQSPVSAFGSQYAENIVYAVLGKKLSKFFFKYCVLEVLGKNLSMFFLNIVFWKFWAKNCLSFFFKYCVLGILGNFFLNTVCPLGVSGENDGEGDGGGV